MSTDDLVNALRDALAARPEIKFAFLFGSAATRGPDRARDIDVAVSLSRSFGLMELAALSDEIEGKLGRAVDLVDLDEASTLLRGEVARDGHVVAARDRDALIEFLARVPIEIDDLRPYFDRESAGLSQALRSEEWSAPISSATKSDA